MNNVKTIIQKLTLNTVSGVVLSAVLSLGMASTAHAGLDEKIAASFAAKYEVCSKKLADKGMLIRALKLKAKADEISRDKLGGGGYIKALVKEKKTAWLIPIKKCKKFADNL